MASADAETSDTLVNISDNISVKFVPNYDKLADRILNRGLNYYTQGYIHNIKIFNEENRVRVVADCSRSMRKNEKPHRLNIDLSDEKITESHCSCKVG